MNKDEKGMNKEYKKYYKSLELLDDFLQTNYEYIHDVDELMNSLCRINEEILKTMKKG
jgi:hypothetical protein